MKTAARILAAALVVLLARSIAYALSPTPLARALEQRAGGPALPTLTVLALLVGGSLAVAICWLAAIGVRERALLERRRLALPAARFRPAHTFVLAIVLSVVTSFAGGLLEAYLHWRAGLGWHGMHCVFGPVHRDLLPIATSLSFVAAALLAAGEHVLAWMRRTFACLRALPPRSLAFPAHTRLTTQSPRAFRRTGHRRSRAPPAFS